MNTIALDSNFERNKNIKAFTYTVLICLLLFFFFFLTKWTLPSIPPPTANEGIEVNLGNSETGSGDIAPEAIGEPSQEQNNTPQPSTAIAAPTEEKVDENGELPVLPTPKSVTPKTNTPVIKAPIKPVVNPTTKTPTPKAVFTGGIKTNTGGNNSDTYNGVKNQGIAGGKGDQGNPNGNPNSDSYNGNNTSGNGIKIKSGLDGRQIAKTPSFQDEFNENAKVAVDVLVDASGKVLAANVNPRGTTTTNSTIKQIAKNKAMLIKFSAGNEEQKGTISFDFKVTN